MKKSYLLGIIASAGLAMTSCSSDEATENVATQGNAIEFGTYLGRDAQTRGTVMDDDALANMGVYASYTGQGAFGSESTPNFMYNQMVTKAGSGWTYNPLKYWPTTQGDQVSFFAYAPYTKASNNVIAATSDNAAKDAPTLTVTLPTDLKDMVDFVADVQLNQEYRGTGTANTPVKFSLKHELTRVGMQACVSQNVYSNAANNTTNKTKVVITDIQLDGIPGGQFYKSGVYTFAKNNGERGTWEGEPSTEAVNLNSLQTKTQYTSTIATGYNKSGIILEGKTPVSLFTKDQYLFLIPVNGTTGMAENDKATATITYDIVTEDAALNGGCSVTHAVKTVAIPTGTLAQGKAYTLTFTINVDEVKLSADVADWEDTTAGTTVDYGSTDKK